MIDRIGGGLKDYVPFMLRLGLAAIFIVRGAFSLTGLYGSPSTKSIVIAVVQILGGLRAGGPAGVSDRRRPPGAGVLPARAPGVPGVPGDGGRALRRRRRKVERRRRKEEEGLGPAAVSFLNRNLYRIPS